MSQPAAEEDLPYRAKVVPLRFEHVGVANVCLLPLRLAAWVGLWAWALAATLAYAYCQSWPGADALFKANAKASSRLLLVAAGFRVRVVGASYADDLARTTLNRHAVVSNHVAIYDPWTLMAAVGPVAFVARRGLFSAPIVGRFLTAMGAVGVDRRASASPGGGGARHVISERLSGDTFVKWPLLVFPEGATTTGRGLAAFRSGAFAPRAPVLPVVIRYTCASGFDLSYTDNQPSARTVARHFLRCLLERGKTVDINVLAPLRPTPLLRADAATYAGAVRTTMLGALPGARDWHDWDNRRMREAWYGADAASKD